MLKLFSYFTSFFKDIIIKVFDILVIGAGASGLFFANQIKNKNIAIIEQNKSIAKKLLISGGAKCNFSNDNINKNNYLCDDYEFLDEVLKTFNTKKSLEFFKQIPFVKIRKQQYFARSSKDVLMQITKNIKAKIFLNQKVLQVNKQNNLYKINTNKAEFFAKNVVFASGGISFSELGVSDIALSVAKDFNIKYLDFSPALVPFTLQKDEFFMKNLSGISLEVIIKIDKKSFCNSLLFTHKSLSGPAVLSASLFWKKGKISIDFLNSKKIDFTSNTSFINSSLLAKNMAKEFLKAFHLENKALNKYTKDEQEILKRLSDYSFAPAGTLGFNKAEICKGGILLKELNNNFESKTHKGLFFIGECLNVGGILGGFNIHFAFASAFVLAKYFNKNYI